MPISDAAGKKRPQEAACPINGILGSMHIGMFFSGLAGGGTQRRMLALARGFAARGHEVDILVASAEGAFRAEVPPDAGLVALGADWRRLPLIGRHRGLWVPLAARALGRRLRAAPPDVLLASSTPANLTASLVRRRAAPATATMSRSPPNRRRKRHPTAATRSSTSAAAAATAARAS